LLGAGGLHRRMRSCVEAEGSSEGCGSSSACAQAPSTEDVRAALARAGRGSPGGGIAFLSASRLLRFALGFSGVSSSSASNSGALGAGSGSGSSSSAGNCDSTMAAASLWSLCQCRIWQLWRELRTFLLLASPLQYAHAAPQPSRARARRRRRAQRSACAKARQLHLLAHAASVAAAKLL